MFEKTFSRHIGWFHLDSEKQAGNIQHTACSSLLEPGGRVGNVRFDPLCVSGGVKPTGLVTSGKGCPGLRPLAPSLCPVSRRSNAGSVTDSFSWCPLPLQAAPLLVHVSSFAATSHKKKLYVIGGGPNGKLATDKTQCYDPSTNKWNLKSPMPVEAKCINAVSFRNHIYVVGK